jgi:hypothetical protein
LCVTGALLKKNKKMRTFTRLSTLFLLFSLIATASLKAQWIKTSGEIIKETRELPGFTSVKNNCSADVVITQGNVQKVVVESDKNLVPHISTEVKNGSLFIDVRASYKNVKVIRVLLTVPDLNAVTIAGSGDVSFVDTFKGNVMRVDIKGSGDFSGDFDLKKLDYFVKGSGDGEISGVRGDLSIKISGSGDFEADKLRLEKCDISVAGSGDIELKGSSDKLVIGLKGSGYVNAYELAAVDVLVKVEGSGDIEVYPIESLNVSVFGSGDVYFKGNPNKVNIAEEGSGEVHKR